MAVYNPEDVARVASERQPAPPPFVLPVGPPKGGGNGHGRPYTDPRQALARPAGADPVAQFFALLLERLQSPPSPPSPPLGGERGGEALFLTLAEASAVTGLSQAFLRRMIAAGTLTAIRDRGRRIRRKDLEAL